MLLIYTNIINLFQYYKLVSFIIICLLIVIIIPIITYVVSPNSRSTEKLSSYECGFEPFDDTRGTFDIHFYIIAILFIVFDLEIAFVFPWARILYFLGALGFWTMMLFLALLTVGFIYEWKRGALDWVTKIPDSLRK